MSDPKNESKELALENIISGAIQIPGVKVDRKSFLASTFTSEKDDLQVILDLGPVAANIPQEKLISLANKLILTRTSQSSLASFAAGIPGGLAMAATIPLDIMQFFGMSLRLAQELSYLYGAQDLWQDGQLDDDKVKNQMVLYCGVMFGVSSAVSGIRVLSAQLAKTALKKIPQKALTKTFWYPIVKQICKALSIKITKSTVAKGVSKAVPVLGGFISGGLNFASMMPMANRLKDALDSAAFGYSEEQMQQDIEIIENICEEDEVQQEAPQNESNSVTTKILEGGKKAFDGLGGLFGAKKSSAPVAKQQTSDDIYESLEKLASLKDKGIITQEEFDAKKADLLSKL